MNGGNYACLAIGNENRDAVSHPNADRSGRIDGNDGIGFRQAVDPLPGSNDQHAATMHLLHADDVRTGAAQRVAKSIEITREAFARECQRAGREQVRGQAAYACAHKDSTCGAVDCREPVAFQLAAMITPGVRTGPNRAWT